MNYLETATTIGQRYLGRGLLYMKKYSPEILTALGILGGVTTTVLAVKATLNVEPLITDFEANVSEHKETRKAFSVKQYPHHIYAKEMAGVYTHHSVKIIKLYGPTISFGLASAGCVLGAHGIMRSRNAALVVAYQALERGYAAYRRRVVEELGDNKDHDYRYGVHDEKAHLLTKEDGKRSRVIDATVDGSTFSPYARFFDESSQNWTKTPEYNHMFLNCQQNWANDRLKARGHLFLNEVYDALGLPRSQAGQVVGWFLGDSGDNYVDFGIYDLENNEHRAFVNGFERSILLDFNVDGIVFDKI